MRHLFLILFFSVTLTCVVRPQAYIPFIEGDKMWTEDCVGCNPYDHRISISSFGNDTTVNSKQYTKIIEQIDSYFYYDFIREDTLEKKVYFCEGAPLFCDQLLYDFNLQTGDTFYIEYPDTNCGIQDGFFMPVVSDTIELFAGKNRKKIVLDMFGYNVTWYEGIGDLSNGVFCPDNYVGGSCQLKCYFENSILLYHNPGLSSDCFVYSEPVSYDNELFKVQINNQELNISTNSLSEFCFELFDITGRKRIAEKYKGSTKIDLSELSQGIYIYNIRSDESGYRVSGKVFVSE